MQEKSRKIGKNRIFVVKQKRVGFFVLLAVTLVFLIPHPGLYADDDTNFAYISRGFFRILTAAFQIPRYLLYKTLSEPIGLGTVDGALTGAYYAVAELSGGALDIARGAAPYAKYMVFFL